MFPNLIFVVVAALVPLVMGFLYYHPKVFGNAWMKTCGLTKEKLERANMLVVFGVTFILSLLMSMFLFSLVVHQTDIYSTLINEPGFGEEGSAVMNEINNFMTSYGDRFRTFKHGALHGGLVGGFIGLPILVINGLFERKGFKYGLINAGYWIISLAIMGGILCQWG
ncbi:DUF1761 domain-containing protein [Patiriisocius marinus]|uniref:DUF1761 domain-containing protein n=1 Tax=Patiriisocius marinus TaxID=1397112 RepID=UPI00232F6324|nr:DUF1761 domain-containing protein [Patiriisocius marinus]